MRRLSCRQSEALIALRSAGVASVPQLSRMLKRDRSNLRKRLAALMRRGCVIKFLRPGGIYYFAVPHRIDASLKASVRELIHTMHKQSATNAPANLPQLPQLPELPELPQ